MAVDELTPLLLMLLVVAWLTPPDLDRQDESSDRLDSGSELMLASRDTAYALTTAQSNVAGVRLGKLAASKASDSDVGSFGRQMADDYVKANDQLSAIAQQQSMTLPDVMSVKDEMTLERLNKLSGNAFDKAYIDGMLKDQEAELKASRKEANAGKNINIRGFASQMVSTLQDHLNRIKMIQSKIGSSR